MPQQLRRRRAVATTADCRSSASPLRQLRRRRLYPGTAATATPPPACLSAGSPILVARRRRVSYGRRQHRTPLLTSSATASAPVRAAAASAASPHVRPRNPQVYRTSPLRHRTSAHATRNCTARPVTTSSTSTPTAPFQSARQPSNSSTPRPTFYNQ